MVTIYTDSFPLDPCGRDTGSRHNEGRHAPASQDANGPARQGTTPRRGGPRRAVIMIIIVRPAMDAVHHAIVDTIQPIVDET